jgi:hypothetical protein
MTGPRRRLAGAATLAVLLSALLSVVATPVRAARWEMPTSASYVVEPGDGWVEVTVRVRFHNTTPNPPGQFSVFEVIDLVIQRGARDIVARDGRGRLTVRTNTRPGSVRVSVEPRTGVRYRDRTSFTLTYRLPDGAAGVRVRPTVVTFPVWTFGTQGSATVRVPGRYDVSIDGDELVPERTADGWRLESGDVSDPQRWASLVLAVGPASHETLARAVPLAAGTVELQVRAWRDDRRWATRTAGLLSRALPLFEDRIGLPYPGAGALVVEEVVTQPPGGVMDESGSAGAHLLAGYDQPDFALLHQAAHVWLSDEVASDRWIREGFSSWIAARAAEELEVRRPYDPAERRERLSDDAFPLISWGEGESTAAQDAYADAASWAVAERLASRVGGDAVRLAWQRIVAGQDAYEPVTDAVPAVDRPAADRQPADSRALLDQLEAVSGQDLDRIFATWVFDAGTADLLPQRVEARERHAELLEAAGDWGAPMPVTVDLAAWRFDSARQRIDETLAWLRERDLLAEQAATLGLVLPDRLRDRYRTAGGGPDARAELDAEVAVVRAYSEALGANAREHDLLERIGLLGGPDRDQQLREANAAFAEGDLRRAAEVTGRVQEQLDSARTLGIVRILAAAALIVILLALAIALVRRRGPREGSRYTSAP